MRTHTGVIYLFTSGLKMFQFMRLTSELSKFPFRRIIFLPVNTYYTSKMNLCFVLLFAFVLIIYVHCLYKKDMETLLSSF